MVLNKRMLRPMDSAQYAGAISEVVTDFTKRIHHLCQHSETGDLVTNISNEFYLFSLEGMIKSFFNDLNLNNTKVLIVYFFSSSKPGNLQHRYCLNIV